VDHAARCIRMYVHGCLAGAPDPVTCVATSADGLHFEARPEQLGASYWRVFEWDGWHYALEMPGPLRRSRNPLTGFTPGPRLFAPQRRHSAVLPHGHMLHVFWSNAGDCPERILTCDIDLRPDWWERRTSEPIPSFQPQLDWEDWEGADQPLLPSKRGLIRQRARQLRDPAVFTEAGPRLPALRRGGGAWDRRCGSGRHLIDRTSVLAAGAARRGSRCHVATFRPLRWTKRRLRLLAASCCRVSVV
jgi:hypothetical protein